MNNNKNKIVVVLHGIILLSYLKTICDVFEFDGKNFNIEYRNKVILNGTPKNPSVYKIEFNDNNTITNIEQV